MNLDPVSAISAPWWRRRWAPARPSPGTGRDRPLDGLRGLCAGLVFYAHAFAPTGEVDPRWAPSPRFWWFNLGYFAVLMFFVLSGYAIGLSVTQPATGEEMRRYVTRRAQRLVPINTAAVLISWALLPALGPGLILGNLFFLQNSAAYFGAVHFNLLPNNPNLWSLNYELVYYAGFLAVWRWRPPVGATWAVLLAITLSPLAGVPMPDILARYACGALFWIGGVSVAWLSDPPDEAPAGTHWPSALLGAYVIWMLAPLRNALIDLQVNPVLLAVTGRAPALQRKLALVCLGWATLGYIRSATSGPIGELDGVVGGALLTAWLLLRWRPGRRTLAWLAPLGGVAFGLYALAAPVQQAQRNLLPAFSGSALTFAVRLITTLAVTLGLAWLLEHTFQSWLRTRRTR
jgi:peptidoglycan/LPS O-acetylase OafA/YrhL